MDNLIIAPLIVFFVAGFALNILDIAQDSSQKITDFAESMNQATDCAINGEPLSDCNQDITTYNFKSDLENYKSINQEYLKNLNNILENATIIEQDGKIYIILDK